jgi:hypothetical protein
MIKNYMITHEINGTKYTAQFSGLSAWYRLLDMAKNDNGEGVSNEKFAAETLKLGLVEPKMTVDDFGDADELEEVLKFVQNVMKGKFRGEVNTESRTKAKSAG